MTQIKELPITADIRAAGVLDEYTYRIGSYSGGSTTMVDLLLPYEMGVSLVYPIDIRTMRARVRESEAAERRVVAERFAAAAHKLAFVREVWFEDSDEPTITVVVHGAGLDDELRLEAVLASADQPGQAFDGYLRVYGDDDVPVYARSGEKI